MKTKIPQSKTKHQTPR